MNPAPFRDSRSASQLCSEPANKSTPKTSARKQWVTRHLIGLDSMQVESAPYPVRAALAASGMDNLDERSVFHFSGKSPLNYLVAAGSRNLDLALSICVQFDAMRFPVVRLEAARYFILSIWQANPESRILRIPNARPDRRTGVLERMSGISRVPSETTGLIPCIDEYGYRHVVWNSLI